MNDIEIKISLDAGIKPQYQIGMNADCTQLQAVVYRKLVPDDIPRAVALRKLQLLEEGAAATADITQVLWDFYERHLKDGTFISWIAVIHDEIIAASGISFAEKPPYYSNISGRIGILSSMYTLPAYRRRGIAKKLLDLAVNEAKQHACASVYITASEMGAPLYENYGFQRNDHFFQYNF